MTADQIQAWAQSVGVSPDDEGFGIIALAYTAGRAAALEEAAKVCIREGEIGRIDGKNTYGECHENASRECAMAIRALAAAEKEPT